MTTTVENNLEALFGENAANVMAMFQQHEQVSNSELTETEVLRILYHRDPSYDLHGELPTLELRRDREAQPIFEAR
jgi:hypothetical protein